MIQAAYLTAIGMGTAVGLLLVLISSIVITKVITNRLYRASDPKTFDEKEENIRQATAAAVAVSILKAKATESSPGN
ncbi:hypothetical protein M1N56_07530 [Dehalococcoidia bacterium]|nr:hypothetical protein [Dehalococcoidia bacterium]